MRRANKICLSLLLALAAAAAAGAHPHMALESRLEFQMRGRDCVAIQVEWTFDSLFSASIIGEYDADRDGSFSKAENETVRQRAFSNLANYGYFISLRKGSERTTPAKVDGFAASQRDGRLVYRFRVPLEGLGYRDDFAVAVFDATFYCAVNIPEDAGRAVRAAGAPETSLPRIEAAPNKKYPVFYNPSGAADDFRVYKQWQKGLETAYPEEIRVFFAE